MMNSIMSIEKNATIIRLSSFSHVQHEYVGHTRSQSLLSVHPTISRKRKPANNSSQNGDGQLKD